jgi:predicted DCC family thiol-disulfide oxidoreductase YuxK
VTTPLGSVSNLADPGSGARLIELDLPPATVFFDGVCGFCDREVQWLLRRDPEGRIHYAPLQGETATAVRAALPGSIPVELDTMVFAERDGDGVRFSYRSDAAMRILRVSNASPWTLRFLRFVPRPLRELGYRIIARTRYRVWGKLDACRVPTAEQRDRFLP